MTFYTLDTGWPLLILAARGTIRKAFTIREGDKLTKVVLTGTDVVRFKLWEDEDIAPLLDIDSVGATANGSVVTVDEVGNGSTLDAKVTVTFAQNDLAVIPPGDYFGELALVDDSDSDYYKPICRGPVRVLGSPTGDRGLT